MSRRFPVTIGSRGECARLFFADLADRPILRRRRALKDERAFAVPGNIICSRPAVAAAHPLAVLDSHISLYIVVEAADRPAMMRFARGILLARFAIEKNIRPANASAHYKRVSTCFRFAPLDQILLTVNTETI